LFHPFFKIFFCHLMHGIKRRVKSTGEIENERKEQEKKKIAQFCDLSSQFEKLREADARSEQLLDITKKLLEVGTEFYTLWNCRREVFQSLQQSKNADEMETLYDKELKFLEQSIASSPKSYWCWKHRVWITSQMKNCNWERELKLCGKLLELDERNFHCWNYRRYVSSKANKTWTEEFAFTTKKIEDNFSNYSAWHQRSVILDHHFKLNDTDALALIKQEFELVQNAFYTEPNDQSAWFYHRWLTDKVEVLAITEDQKTSLLQQEVTMCENLLEIEPNCKWALLTKTLLQGKLNKSQPNEADLDHLQKIDPLRSQYYQYLKTNSLAVH